MAAPTERHCSTLVIIACLWRKGAMLIMAELDALDATDPLAPLRARFILPPGLIYLDGNSLGPLPAALPDMLAHTVQAEWGQGLIRSWNDAGWIDLPVRLGAAIAPLLVGGLDRVGVGVHGMIRTVKEMTVGLNHPVVPSSECSRTRESSGVWQKHLNSHEFRYANLPPRCELEATVTAGVCQVLLFVRIVPGWLIFTSKPALPLRASGSSSSTPPKTINTESKACNVDISGLLHRRRRDTIRLNRSDERRSGFPA